MWPVLALLAALAPAPALGHATEGGLVLLLPTDLSIAGGAATVLLTVLLVTLLPDRFALGLFRPLPLWRSRRARLPQRTRLAAVLALANVLGQALAARMLGDARKAALSQAPLAAFMVLYTLFGLWLLASPRGV